MRILQFSLDIERSLNKGIGICNICRSYIYCIFSYSIQEIQFDPICMIELFERLGVVSDTHTLGTASCALKDSVLFQFAIWVQLAKSLPIGSKTNPILLWFHDHPGVLLG